MIIFYFLLFFFLVLVFFSNHICSLFVWRRVDYVICCDELQIDLKFMLLFFCLRREEMVDEEISNAVSFGRRQ